MDSGYISCAPWFSLYVNAHYKCLPIESNFVCLIVTKVGFKISAKSSNIQWRYMLCMLALSMHAHVNLSFTTQKGLIVVVVIVVVVIAVGVG